MRIRLACLLVLFFAGPTAAQNRPIAGTTLNLTDTSADSIHVGCAIGSSTCTGGIKAGPVDVSQVVSAGAITIASNVPGVTTNKLYNNGGTLTWAGVALALGGAVGPGTVGKLAKFTGAAAVGDSICSEAGTTITCVNTVAATTGTFTNVAGTLSTASQPSVTTMAGLTSAAALATVGTITAGTWQGTAIDVTRGGAGVSLAATGGTSQFLRQNGVGSTISVVRPAISDLSDASNVALLNAVNTFTAFGTHTFSAGAIGTNVLKIENTSSGVANLARLSVDAGTNVAGGVYAYSQGYTTSGLAIASSVLFYAPAAGGATLAAQDAAGVIRLVTGGTSPRWGVNAAGDWTFGASAHIADSNGTPALTTCTNCGSATIAGTDYAIRVTMGTTTGAQIVTVTFGHTFSNAPVCNVNSSVNFAAGVTTSTTQVIFNSNDIGNGQYFSVLCRGY